MNQTELENQLSGGEGAGALFQEWPLRPFLLLKGSILTMHALLWIHPLWGISKDRGQGGSYSSGRGQNKLEQNK